MLEILTWLETMCDYLIPPGTDDLPPPPSREQLVWSCRARAPLGLAQDGLPTYERQPDDPSITSVEIRNSYAPTLPACVGKYSRVQLCS